MAFRKSLKRRDTGRKGIVSTVHRKDARLQEVLSYVFWVGRRIWNAEGGKRMKAIWFKEAKYLNRKEGQGIIRSTPVSWYFPRLFIVDLLKGRDKAVWGGGRRKPAAANRSNRKKERVKVKGYCRPIFEG